MGCTFCRDAMGSAQRSGVKIRPFKGYLANEENVANIISPAYDVLNTKEAREMRGDNEMCFLRVNKPEIDLEDDVDPYDTSVYEKGYENLQEFIAKEFIVQDKEDTMYIYRQVMGDHC